MGLGSRSQGLCFVPGVQGLGPRNLMLIFRTCNSSNLLLVSNASSTNPVSGAVSEGNGSLDEQQLVNLLQHFVIKLSLRLCFGGAGGDLVEREFPVGVEDLLAEDQRAGCAGKEMA
eukprot:3940427-Rhodomonas_salina.1